jgi:hypothetical protein
MPKTPFHHIALDCDAATQRDIDQPAWTLVALCFREVSERCTCDMRHQLLYFSRDFDSLNALAKLAAGSPGDDYNRR